MKFLFKYKKFGSFYRPIIPIRLKLEKKTFQYEALIDSGSDICIFHKEIGELLGLNCDRLSPVHFQGISSQTSTIGYKAIIDIGVGNYFHSAPVIFSDEISQSGYGILGQTGFFEYFKIKFNFPLKSIQIKTL